MIRATRILAKMRPPLPPRGQLLPPLFSTKDLRSRGSGSTTTGGGGGGRWRRGDFFCAPVPTTTRRGAAAASSSTSSLRQQQVISEAVVTATSYPTAVRALVESLASATAASSSSSSSSSMADAARSPSRPPFASLFPHDPTRRRPQGGVEAANVVVDDDDELPPWLRYFEHLGGRQQQQELSATSKRAAIAAARTAAAIEIDIEVDDDDDEYVDDNQGRGPLEPLRDETGAAFAGGGGDERSRRTVSWALSNGTAQPQQEEEEDFEFAVESPLVGNGAWDRTPAEAEAGAHHRPPPVDDSSSLNDDGRDNPNSNATTTSSSSPLTPSSTQQLIDTLDETVRNRDTDGAVRAFEQLEYWMRVERRARKQMNATERITTSPIIVPLGLLKRLSVLVGYQPKCPPIVAHRVLQCYQRQHELQQQQQQLHQQSPPETSWEQHDDEPPIDDDIDPSTHPSFPSRVNPELINQMVDWYRSICYNVRFFDPHRHSAIDIQRVVRGVVADLRHMSTDHQKSLYPVLISSLVAQRSVAVGKLAYPVFESLVEITSTENHGDGSSSAPISAPYLEHLLGYAKYHRHGDLPYPKILHLIAQQRRPYPVHAVAILEYLFPFDNFQDDTATVLRTLVDLQSSTPQSQSTITAESDVSSTSPPSPKDAVRDAYRYVVDISTLEAIGASAARNGNVELSLLVWDAVHVMGHRSPTPAIYENLVLVFCAHPQHYGSAFTVLAEMQERGYAVPRALIRSMSTCLRPHASQLDSALAALKELRMNGLHVTAAMLNAIMSGAAERGDIDRTLSLLEEFGRNGVAPDADSYSFAMEALGKHLSRRTKTPAGQQLRDQCLDTANSLLTRMEEEGILPTHHIIRDYVELLCRTGQVGVATDIVLESLELKTTDSEAGAMPLVADKTIYRVAMANVKIKDFKAARQVAACASEQLPFLWRSIEAHELGEPFVDKYMEG